MLNISVENNFFLNQFKVKKKRQSTKRKQKQNIQSLKKKNTTAKAKAFTKMNTDG